MLEAERKCGRVLIPWSPIRKLHYHIYLYWHLQHSLLKYPRNIEHGLQDCRHIITTMLQTNKPGNPDDEIYQIDDLTNITKKWRKAKRVLDNITYEAPKHRREHLAYQQLEHSNKNEKKKEKAVGNIIRSEQRNQDFKVIRMYTKQMEKGDMKYIEVPVNEDDDPKDKKTKWKRLDDVDKINNALTKS